LILRLLLFLDFPLPFATLFLRRRDADADSQMPVCRLITPASF